MKIKPKDEYTYLFNKSRAYHLGWEFCVGGKDALTSRKQLPTAQEREEFDQGYGDCYANGESEPEAFDYVEGI